MTNTIESIQDINLALQESPVAHIVLPLLRRFEHLEILDYMQVAKALLEVVTETKKDSNEKWAEVING